MLLKIVASRGFVSVLGILLVGALTVATYVVVAKPGRTMLAYCALMPDSTGLYVDNHVTMRGIPIGTVTSIEPAGTQVRVNFDIEADYPLPGDVSATTVSDTLVADRNLAVLSADGWGHWDPNTCITKTLTPKSLTETLAAVAEFSGAAAGPGDDKPLENGLRALSSALDGTGPQLNRIIRDLGAALRSPDAAIGNIAGIIDALASLSSRIAAGWNGIQTMTARLTPVLNQVNDELFAKVPPLVDEFARVLPMLNDITTMFGGPILRLLDAAVPLVKFIAANVGTLQELITMVPPIVNAFTRAVDASGRVGVGYAPPRVALPKREADLVCASVHAVSPGRCADAGNGLVSVDLARLVLAVAGVR